MMTSAAFHRALSSLGRWLLAALALGAPALRAQPNAAVPPDTLCVMTYNLRYANSNPSELWSKRRPIMRDLLRRVSPDVVGTQEGLYQQLKDLAADLPEYDWIGLGREGGSRGEFMAVFYRKARLEPLAFDHFWLSDTPNVIGSKTWGTKLPRMVTWVQFRDRATSKEFYLFNTHFDHQVQAAREKSAALIRQRLGALDTDRPVILTGDFNAAAETNLTYTILTRDGFLTDTWKTAPERVGEGIGTFNFFKGPNPGGPRIDWILVRGPVSAQKTEIVTFSRDGVYPSDHFPVVAWLKFGPAQ
jgi:endonuclease/exonuclease/phosphatase family metal-dependent hydrolase